MRLPRTSAAVVGLTGLLVAAAPAALAAPAAAAGRAPVVRGAILDRWVSLGGRAGFLGAPLASEQRTRPRTGAFSTFAGGSIFWSPRTGAWETHGAIREKWFSQRAENGLLGFPTANEQRSVSGLGAVGHFQRGAVYWSPPTGAHVVRGEVLEAYEGAGEDRVLGFPLTDEIAVSGYFPGDVSSFPGAASPFSGAVSFFQLGAVYWSEAGAFVVRGAIGARWTELGAQRSGLGFPTSGEVPLPGGEVAQEFETGTLVYSPVHGVYAAEVFGTVSSVDRAADTLVLESLRGMPFHYRDSDDFYSISATSLTSKLTRIPADRFEALAPGSFVVVQQDPGGTSAYTVVTDLPHGEPLSERVRAATASGSSRRLRTVHRRPDRLPTPTDGAVPERPRSCRSRCVTPQTASTSSSVLRDLDVDGLVPPLGSASRLARLRSQTGLELPEVRAQFRVLRGEPHDRPGTAWSARWPSAWCARRRGR